MSKKCTNCGTELKEKAKFCPVCGTAVPEEINEVVKPKLAGKKIAMAVVAGAVLVGGGFAVYGKIGAKSSQQKEPVKVENSTKRDETAKTEQKEQEEPQKEETGSYRYQWMVQPEIEADQIYYGVDSGDSYNENHRQMINEYAIIEKDGLKGFIDSYGALRTKIEYQRIIAHGNVDAYSMKDQQGNKYTLATSEEDVIVAYEDDSDEEAKVDENDFVEETDGLTDNIYWNGYYYYDGEVRNAHISDYADSRTSSFMPVQQSTEMLWSLSEWEKLDGKYALANNGELITDFIYDECGSCGNVELIAVCKDGKWGYINSTGKKSFHCNLMLHGTDIAPMK